MAKYVVCLTTVGKQKDADRIARHLVEARLVACVNIVPGVVSHYHWKKKLRRDREWILVMKTVSQKVKALEEELRSIHPYELPEFVILPILAGSRSYLRWIEESLASPRGQASSP